MKRPEMQINVCPLSKVENTVSSIGAKHLLTLLNLGTPMQRPSLIEENRHLYLGMNDIHEHADGQILPGNDHMSQMLAFIQAWDRQTPLLIHCYAGVSRSTAAAYAAACMLVPGLDEYELARTLRRLSPTATPNRRIIALADAHLGRQGRMIDAIAQIGRGEECFEGIPFALHL